jgi:hypothetical protein
MPTDHSERFRVESDSLATRCDPVMDHGLFLTLIAEAA